LRALLNEVRKQGALRSILKDKVNCGLRLVDFKELDDAVGVAEGPMNSDLVKEVVGAVLHLEYLGFAEDLDRYLLSSTAGAYLLLANTLCEIDGTGDPFAKHGQIFVGLPDTG
jgi:hypothetical protein